MSKNLAHNPGLTGIKNMHNSGLFTKSCLIIFLLVPLVSYGDQSCPLSGYWKSNEKLTLESFSQAKSKTEKQKEVFGSGFFGKLILFVECDQFTSVYEGWVETTQYELVSINKNEIIIKYKEFPQDEAPTEKTTYISHDGNCYSIPINGGQFMEFFCKSNEQEFNTAMQSQVAQ